LADAGLMEAQTVAIDGTTLEANAAMRSIRRRDDGRSYDEYLRGLAQAAGIEQPTREQLARLDRKRKKKASNQEWMSPADPDARIAKMKDGRTHLAHKAEHAVDLATGAVVAVTLQGADQGDTTTIHNTPGEAHANAQMVNARGVEEVVADKGYHSGAALVGLQRAAVRSYIPEPEHGRRGKALQRLRSELVERSFAHMYETGGMRRTHLRGTNNILKRLLIQAVGFNLALLVRERLLCVQIVLFALAAAEWAAEEGRDAAAA
jgi:transposase